MATKRNPIIQHITFYSVLFFFKFFSLLPLNLVRKSATILATMAYHLVPRIQKVGMANLDIAYGDALSKDEKEEILRESVKNLALVAVEFPTVSSLLQKIPTLNITILGRENIIPDQGCVIVSAHLGNWEWLLPVGVHIGLRPIVVARPFDDRRMDALIDGVRRDSGVKTVPKDAAMGPLLRKLQDGWHAGLLADQNPREDAVPVTFFGTSTWATIGPAIIAMRSQTPLVPVSIIRNKDGNYTVEFFPALHLEDSGDTFADLHTNTQRCQDALEAIIRKNPGQWLWFHKRWKKRDRLEREWAERLNKRKSPTEDDSTSTPEKE